MKCGVKARLSDGFIKEAITVTQDSDFLLNYDSQTEELIEVAITHAVLAHVDEWRVVDHVLVQKNQIILTPDKTVFTADGADTCNITVSGFVHDVYVEVNGDRVLITSADSVLTLTSETPRTFYLSPVNDLEHFGYPSNVQAS